MDQRAIARMLASGRVAIGAGLLALPGRVTATWIGEAGRGPGPKLVGRALGGRDLVLGLGVLDALDRGDPRARDWIRAAAVADLVDAAATVLAFRHLPPRRRTVVLVLAAGAAVAGFLAADGLDRP